MSDPNDPNLGQHPRGTLAILLVYAVVFVAGWLALYFLLYLKRGPVGS
jgi:hypothetical protein